MRLTSTAVTLLSFPMTTLSQEQCLTGSFTLEFDGTCTAAAVLEAYEDQVYGMTGSIPATCTTSAEEDLKAKLDAAGLDLDSLCDNVYASQEKVPFTNAAKRGTDLHFESMFYNGRGDWQEEVETIHETEHATATSVLKQDAEAVNTFYRGTAQGRRVDWPGTLPNFQSSVTDSDGLATCTTNAAMCCWPKDREADADGNCAKPYDENCVDKDPADNTDLCFVDPERGSASTGFHSTDGFLVYPWDNIEGEGSIHCHGMAWSNDVNHYTARYKANNLFFMSMYDNMYSRGYVKNIPGAPMCGCVEQMPTVTRSDCTQVDVEETVKITYDATAGTFESKLAYVNVDFNECRGIHNRKNDLWAYMGRLYYQGDITPHQYGQAGRIITNSDCEEATRFHLNKKSFTPGYDHDVDLWTNVAGRESMYLHDHYGHRAFHRSLVAGTDPDNMHYGIIYRACESCGRTHKKIYYRRTTPVPDGLDLINVLLYRNQPVDHNVWNIDFTLHSTYEDAVTGEHAWLCPNGEFDYGAAFYGECSPDGTRVRNQYSRFHILHDKHDVGFFTNKAEDDGLQMIPTTAIKGGGDADGIALKDPSDGTIYMTGRGRDIWNQDDDFNYLSEEFEGDVNVVVHAGSLSNYDPDPWAKTGIMIRSGLETNAAHYGLYLTGSRGICFQGRPSAGAFSQFWGCVEGGATEAWLKVEKRGDTYTSFRGAQAAGGGRIQWTRVHSREIPAVGEGRYRVGLAVASVRSYPQEVIFSGYSVSALQVMPTTAIRGRGSADGTALMDPSDGTIYMTGQGRDIWNQADDFNYLSEEFEGDVTIEVHAGSLFSRQPYPWAKTGIMIRSGLEANAAFYGLYLTGSNGICFQGRPAAGANAQHWGCIEPRLAEAWLKVEKRGDAYASFRGTQAAGGGPVAWTRVHAGDFPAVGEGRYRVGLAVSSVTPSPQEVTFSGYSALQVMPTTAIRGRGYADGAALMDPSDGTIYMTGQGRDIWNQDDDFNYLSEEFEGDVTIAVHAGSLFNRQPHPWAKTGIMIRSGLEANAAHYGLYLTGSNGVCFQGRPAVGAGSQFWGCVEGGATEAWLKVEKRGDAYASFRGTQAAGGGPVAWTRVHAGNFPAIGEGRYRVGLAVASVAPSPQEVTFSGYSVESYESHRRRAESYSSPSMASSTAAPTSGSAEVKVSRHTAARRLRGG